MTTAAPTAAELRALPPAEAVARLVELYGSTLYRLGLHQCGDEEEARDLVQETFAVAFRKWRQFEGRSAPSSWLYTIAVRLCRRAHRRRAGEPEAHLSLDDLLPGHDAAMAVVPEATDPEANAIRGEARVAVDRAILRLPIRYRMPLLLKEIAELTIEEVAAILALKTATVKTRVHRARLMLRKELERVLPRADLAAPDHDRAICLDLLRAKQEALDHGAEFTSAEGELCSRCRALFDSLDLTQQVCRELHAGAELPPRLREVVLGSFAE